VGRWKISSTFGEAEGGYGISALPVIAARFAAHPARSRSPETAAAQLHVRNRIDSSISVSTASSFPTPP
jgi:hypothetical protein